MYFYLFSKPWNIVNKSKRQVNGNGGSTYLEMMGEGTLDSRVFI